MNYMGRTPRRLSEEPPKLDDVRADRRAFITARRHASSLQPARRHALRVGGTSACRPDRRGRDVLDPRARCARLPNRHLVFVASVEASPPGGSGSELSPIPGLPRLRFKGQFGRVRVGFFSRLCVERLAKPQTFSTSVTTRLSKGHHARTHRVHFDINNGYSHVFDRVRLRRHCHV